MTTMHVVADGEIAVRVQRGGRGWVLVSQDERANQCTTAITLRRNPSVHTGYVKGLGESSILACAAMRGAHIYPSLDAVREAIAESVCE